MLALLVACAHPPPAVVQPGEAVVRNHPAGIGSITELLRGDNAFVARLELAPGARIPDNVDVTEEYVVVLEGHGSTTIDGVVHPLSPGTAIYIPPGVSAGAVNGDEPMVVLQVFAGPKPADKYQSWPEAR